MKRLRYLEEGNLSKDDLIEIISRFQTIAEMGNDGIIIFDADYSIEFANEMASGLTGYPHERLTEMKFTDLLSSRNQAFLTEMAGHVEESESSRICAEMEIITADGEKRETEVCITMAREGKGMRTYAYLRDISLRKKMENELRKANEFFRNLIESSVDGIIAADMKGKTLLFNEAAEKLLGYKAEEVIGEHITKIYPSNEAYEIMAKLRSEDYGGVGKLKPIQYQVISKYGETIPISVSAAIIYENGEEIATVGIFTDLRDRIKMEQELQKTHLKLLQADKMASLGKLAAGVAHEINNPLGGILIYAGLLLEEMKGDDSKRKDLELIVSEATRCKQIVKDLLEFAYQTGEEFEFVDINRSIEQCLSLLQNQALFHNVKIEKRFYPKLPQIRGNGGQLNQVFTNIIVNAAEAMPNGGTLTIVTNSLPSQGSVRIEFADTGCGIPEELLGRIFDPFFTTKDVGKGTGLGLSISYGIIVEGHKGKIAAKSKVGEGTTFIIDLPLGYEER